MRRQHLAWDITVGAMIVVIAVGILLLSFGCSSLLIMGEQAVKASEAKPLDWQNASWSWFLNQKLTDNEMDRVESLKDAATFCPSYSKLTGPQRLEFWAVFMVAMAKRESSYKPDATYTESFENELGERVVSTGLFQLSYESIRQTPYKCPGVTTAQLKDPMQNIACATNVLAHWVKKDGYAAGTVEKKKLGAGRYWSVGRPGSSQNYISSQTKALAICKL